MYSILFCSTIGEFLCPFPMLNFTASDHEQTIATAHVYVHEPG